MANFYSDSDDDKAVEELLAQAADTVVLEQLAAINCAGFTDLPSHLEARFQKLKSIPSTAAKPSSSPAKGPIISRSPELGVRSEKEAKNPPAKECPESQNSPSSEIKSPCWSSFSSASVSPPAKSGCFLCSPKKRSSRNSKEKAGSGFFSDLSNFSKSQRKIMNKAMDEDEKICREAEKIVKMAKQASLRMKASEIEDELSDHDDNAAKFH